MMSRKKNARIRSERDEKHIHLMNSEKNEFDVLNNGKTQQDSILLCFRTGISTVLKLITYIKLWTCIQAKNHQRNTD